jgi:hypothetical protein
MGEHEPIHDTCPVADCEAPRRPEQLMCRFHWFKVPKAIRNRVWMHWRARQRGDRSAIELHAEASRDAIAAVEAAERPV